MSEPAKFTPADHAAVEISLQERPAQLAPFWTNARALLESADEFTSNAGVRRPPSNGSSRAERLARRAAIAQEAFAELSSALGSVRERVTGSLPGETVIRASVQSVTPQGTVRKGDGSTVDLTAVPSTPEGFQSKGRELLNKWEKHPKVNFEAANPMGSVDSSGSDMEETTFNAKCALQLRFRVAEGASDEAIQLLLDKCAAAEKVASKKFEESDLVDRPFLVNTRREANPDGYGPPSLVLTLLTSEPDPFTQSMAQNVLAENLTHKPLQPFRSLHVNAKLPLSGREWLAGNIPALFSLDGAEGDVELVGNRLDFEVLLNAVAHMANGAADTDNFEGAGDLAVLLKNSLGGSLARSADVSVVLQPFALSIAQAARTDVTSRRRRFMSCGALPLASNMNDEACSRFHASNAVENLALREFIEKSFLWVTGQNMASLVTYEMTKCFLDALEKEGSGSESDDSDQIVSNALSLAASRVATAAHVIESLTSLTIQSSVYDVAVKFTGFNPFSELPKSDRDCIERSRRDVLRYRALVKKEAAEFKKTLRQAKKDEEEDDAEKEKSESSEEEEDDQLYTFSNNVADPNMRLSQIRSLEEDFSDYVEEDYTKYPTFDFETFQPRTSVRVLFVCGEAHESFDARRAVFKSGVGFDLPQRSVRRFTGAEELREQVEESTSLRDDPVLPVVLPYVHGGRRFTLYFLGEKEKVPLCSMHAVVKLVDTFEATEDAEDDDEGSVVPVFVTVGSAGAGKVVRSTSKIALNSASSIGEVLDRIVDQLPSAVRAASADKPLALEF